MRAEVWGWHNIAWLLAAFSWHRERAFKALVCQRLAAAVLAQAHALMLQRPEEPVWVDPDEPLDYTNLIGPTFQIRVENLYDITARISGWIPAVEPDPGQPCAAGGRCGVHSNRDRGLQPRRGLGDRRR